MRQILANIKNGLSQLTLLGFLGRYKHATAYILMPIAGIWFLLLELVNTRPAYIMYTPLDDYIPFVKEMIVPYYIWYLFMAFVFLLTLFKAPADFISVCVYMYGMQLLICLFYTLFPNGQNLRPDIPSVDAFSTLVNMTYTVDTPANSAPSIHVTHTIASFVALWHYKGFVKARKPVLVVSFIISVAIIMSTVMVKQHSLIDVIAGLALALACYPFVYIFRRKPVESRDSLLDGIGGIKIWD